VLSLADAAIAWGETIIDDAHPASPRWRYVVPIATALAGTLFVASAVNADGTDLRAGTADLASVVRNDAREVNALRGDVTSLENELEELGNAIDDRQVRQVRRQVAAVNEVAGLTAVGGPGLVVTLEDAPFDSAPADLDPNLLVVHQQDIQAFINALWAGGATAMSLQDQRLVSTTGVKCVGNTVVLEGVPYAPPYRIEAVGDPNRLRRALEVSETVSEYRRWVELYNLGLTVQEAPQVTVPAYSGRPAMEYARPL
jgi:uncharacterized protein YlxW (UPF0749 family)